MGEDLEIDSIKQKQKSEDGKKPQNKEMSVLETGNEGGMIFKDFDNFKKGDKIECYKLVENTKHFNWKEGIERSY